MWIHIHALFGVRRDQRHRRAARRAVGYVAPNAGHGLRRRGKIDKLPRRIEVGCSRDDAKPARIKYLSVPDNDKGLVFQHLGIEDAPL